MIRFENVVKQFGTNRVLDGLDLEIPEGKITVIIGKSGEGKSVTIKHIMGLLTPTSGRVFVDDRDLSTFSFEQLMDLRRSIGMLFQHAALFDSLSVFENVAFPLKERRSMKESDIKKRVFEVLDQIGLPDIADKFPGELSTGEKKRVGLARALSPNPRIIMYDEPTTGMDPLVSEMIDNLIVDVGRWNPELTSIVISHDLKAALETAENVVMLYKGKVQLAGAPDKFRKVDDPIIRQFFAGKVEGPMEFM
ncbi:MAG: ATP-binding cassette domain-containing protein [Pseudobacteriovorax sp.]|nr:ATP-binding cassette domain-containing protein [Pseudobacteriovorax sp.]